MDTNYICRCSHGCRNCPRLRGCIPTAAPVSAEAPALEQSAPVAEPIQPDQHDAPEAEGTGQPALDTPEYTVPNALEEYLAKNCEHGTLRVQAFRARQAIPVEGVAVTVQCPIGGAARIFFEGSTDESGVIDPILLPAPKPEGSLSPDGTDPCSEYEIIAEHPEYETLTTRAMVFPGVKTIQPLEMQLKAV